MEKNLRIFVWQKKVIAFLLAYESIVFFLFKFDFFSSYFQWVIFNVVKDFVIYMKTILIRQALCFGHEWQSTYTMRKYSEYRNISMCAESSTKIIILKNKNSKVSKTTMGMRK